MAKYQVYGGNFMLPHPYKITDVKGYGVALDGDIGKLNRLVHRLLNRENDSRNYYVVSPTVLFTFMRMGCMQCAAMPERGFFVERELNVTLLLAAVDVKAMTVQLAWYMPYLWLDSGPALTAGRDIYGFPKMIADVALPGLGEAADFSAHAEVFHAPLPSVAIKREIFRACRSAGGLVEQQSNATNAGEALGILLKQVLEIDPILVQMLGFALPTIELNKLRMAFMRQLPSISNFEETSFRSTAEAPFSVTLRSAGLLKGPYAVFIPKHESVKLAEELGIPSDPQGNVVAEAKAAYHMDFDFVLGRGRDVWVET